MAIAHELAAQQREISVSEFFAKNRHLLGFDNKKKALMTTIKEAVDNSLDACEEADILPEISVEVIDMGNERFRVIVEDNGPGIVKKQIPNIFAKLLYGSKFHRMRQSRGQQGIGISASVMYAQLTTGRSAKITSKIGPKDQAHYYELHVNVQKNIPEIVKEDVVEWKKEHGTRIELDIEANYAGGNQSVDEYLKETAIANPSCTIIYTNPKAEQSIFPRVSSELPRKPKEIKPHPYGVELGVLMNMLRFCEERTIQSFLTNEFSKVGSGAAQQILENAAIPPQTKPREMSREMVERLVEGIKKTRIQNPPTDCLSPIGQELVEKGLQKEISAEFYASVTRSPAVYRGNPFQIEVGIAYGGNHPLDQPIRIMRFANRVPLLYQQSACAITRSIIQTSWRGYGLEQSQGAIPSGPCTIMVHMASVWVPFTSESKEAIAHYPEIIKEIKLAVQEAGRRLSIYVNKKKRVAEQQERVNIFENYIPEVADALARISGAGKEKIIAAMRKMLEKNKEYIQAHQEAHRVDAREEEEPAKAGGFDDE